MRIDRLGVPLGLRGVARIGGDAAAERGEDVAAGADLGLLDVLVEDGGGGGGGGRRLLRRSGPLVLGRLLLRLRRLRCRLPRIRRLGRQLGEADQIERDDRAGDERDRDGPQKQSLASRIVFILLLRESDREPGSFHRREGREQAFEGSLERHLARIRERVGDGAVGAGLDVPPQHPADRDRGGAERPVAAVGLGDDPVRLVAQLPARSAARGRPPPGPASPPGAARPPWPRRTS